MKNIVILISGRGSNMVAIAQACLRDRWPARIAAVVADRPDAAGLALARDLGLPAVVVDARGRADREAFDAELADRVAGFEPDLVVLAGYLRVLSTPFVARFAGRLLNIHPSLLPAFPGLATHRRAIEAGVKAHGATVHFVTPALDAGPIVAQAVVPVRPDDDPSALGARVLAVEHQLYPVCVRWFIDGRLRIDAGVVRLSDPAPGESTLLVSTGAPACAGQVSA